MTSWQASDPANPQEIAFFDRGRIGATSLVLGGYWSALTARADHVW